jgi:hypothetical protein
MRRNVRADTFSHVILSILICAVYTRGVLKGRFSKHPGICFGKLYRHKLYKRLTIRELQMPMFLAQKMILQ